MTIRQVRGFIVIVVMLLYPINAYWTAVIIAQTPTVEVPGTPLAPSEPSQPAVPTKEVPSPAAPSNAQDAVGWGLGAAYFMQFLKKTKWFTFLTEESSRRGKAIFGFVVAFLTAAGIQFVVSGSVLDAGGASVGLTGITLIGVKDVLFQWIVQQGWYDAIVRKQDDAALMRRSA